MSSGKIDQVRRRVRLRDLETLVAVANAGSMRKAAGALHLSEPAISKGIRELEDVVGLKLLERGRRGVVPTAFGDALVRRSRALVDDLQNALRELEELADPEYGEVRIGSMETLQAGLVAAAARVQLGRRPRMRLVFELGQSAELLGHFLHQRLVDFAVARPTIWPLPPELDGEALFHDQLLLAVGPGHPFARKRKLRLGDLLEEHWILSRAEVMPNAPVPSAFASEGLAFPAKIVVSGSLNMRQNMLAGGRFVTAVPHSLLAFAKLKESFHILPIELPRWPTPTMIVRLRGRSLTPAAESFVGTLREMSRTLGDH